MDKLDFLSGIDPAIVDELYQTYQSDPESLDEGWRKFFEGFDFANELYPTTKKYGLETSDEFKVINLINDYRRRGHLFTETNPVRKRRTYKHTLDIENYGLEKKYLTRKIQ